MPAQLTVSQLFQPAPSGVGPYGFVNGATVGQVPQVPGAGSWLATMLQIAAAVQLPTTSWQTGAPERTILATEAVCFALSDAAISQMAQGGFLQSAASGTVLYTAVDGTQIVIPVTPDPSNAAQNPTGAPGYLDLLSKGVYDVTRLPASRASGPLAIAKLSAGIISYGAAAYHVGGLGGATYSNPTGFSIPSSVIVAGGGAITAVTSGFGGTGITTGAPHGLAAGQSVYVLIPITSGVTGLAGVFAIVTAATSVTFSIGVGSAGTYSGSGGNVYRCTVAQMVADAVGTASNAGPGTVTTAITQNANMFVSNVVGWSGANYENNASLADRCVLSLAARSPNGPSGAYVYFAETAVQLLADATPSYVLTNGPVRAVEFAQPRTGIVNTVVGSTTPASNVLGANVTPGVSRLAVTGVTASSPAIVSCAGPTTLQIGQSFTVTISGVIGPSIVNTTALGTYVSPTSFSIPIDTSAAPAYAGGGSVEGGDLGQIDALLQRNCVPNGEVAFTLSSQALPIQPTATVTVPAAYVTAYQLAVAAQLQTQVASYAIGGLSAQPVSEVSYNDIIGALEEAGVQGPGQASVAHVQSLSLNGGGIGVGVPFPAVTYQALLANPQISVLGV